MKLSPETANNTGMLPIALAQQFEAAWGAPPALQKSGLSELGEGSVREPLWLHMSYTNFKLYEVAATMLIESDNQDSTSEIKLCVTEKLDVATLREFALRMDLTLPWTAKWYQILVDPKPLPSQEVKAESIFVVQMPEPKIPDALVWKGSEQEYADRKHVEPQVRAQTGTKRRGPGRGPLFPPLHAIEDMVTTTQDPDEQDPDEQDSFRLFDDTSGESEQEGAESALMELVDLAEILAPGDAATTQPDEMDKPDRKKNSSLTKAKTGDEPSKHSMPEPASSSGARANMVDEPAAASSSSHVAHVPDESAAPSRATAKRVKEVSEDVLVLPGVGDIRYNPKSKVLVAHCHSPKHGSHICKRQRTAQTGRTTGQGRPLGHLAAWLLQHDQYPDQSSHVSSNIQVDRRARKEGRSYLKTLQGCDRFFAFESARENDTDSEPEVVR